MYSIINTMKVCAIGALLLTVSAPLFGQRRKENSAGKDSVERHLQSKYSLTAFSPLKGAVGQPGVAFQVQRPGLEAGPVTGGDMPGFSYADGKLKKHLIGKPRLGNFGIPSVQTGLLPLPITTFFYTTKIDAKESHVTFELVTADPLGDTWYKTSINFDFPKGYLESPDFNLIDKTIAELFVIEQAPPAGGKPGQAPVSQGGGGGSAAKPPPSSASPTSSAPPPPPPPPPPPAPPSEPVEIKPGMTADQVTSALGPPSNVLKVGAKQIYVYKNYKITLVNGKVTSAE